MSRDPDAMRSKRFLNPHAILLILFLPPILYYIFVQLQDGWDKLRHYPWDFNLGYFLLSIIVAFLYFVLTSWVWQRVLSYFGTELGLWQSFRILQLAQLGKYLPGRVWAIGGQLYLGEREGLSRNILLWTTGLHWFGNLLAGAIIFLPFLYGLVPARVAVLGTLVVLVLLSLGFFPRPIFGLFSDELESGRQGRLASGLLRLTPTQALTVLCGFLFAWCVFGFALWLMVNAFMDLSLGAYYEVLASFCGAWAVGVLSFFAPAGIGVREGAWVYLLGQFLHPSLAVIISIAARLWITVVELACAAIAWFIQ